MVINSLKRIETKYILTKEQEKAFLEESKKYFVPTAYCKDYSFPVVKSIYYDTDDNFLISNSISKPYFKQKIRARKYEDENQIYLEIKQKCNRVVSKRRVKLSFNELDSIIKDRKFPCRDNYIDNQVFKEIDQFLSVYKVFPKIAISYKRLTLRAIDSSDIRITIDEDIRSSRDNFDWDSMDQNKKIFDDDVVILEIKTENQFPLYLANILSKLKIYKNSFSKYGAEYKKYLGGE